MIGLKKVKIENEKMGMHGYKAAVYNHGTLSIDDVAKMMSLSNTVTRADVLSVIAALKQVVEQDLLSGYSVSLGDVGTLQIRLASKGAEQAKDWGTDMITATRVRLVPSAALKQAIRLGATGISLRMA